MSPSGEREGCQFMKVNPRPAGTISPWKTLCQAWRLVAFQLAVGIMVPIL